MTPRFRRYAGLLNQKLAGLTIVVLPGMTQPGSLRRHVASLCISCIAESSRTYIEAAALRCAPPRRRFRGTVISMV